jgi:hypothetical protein
MVYRRLMPDKSAVPVRPGLRSSRRETSPRLTDLATDPKTVPAHLLKMPGDGRTTIVRVHRMREEGDTRA